MDVLGIIKAVAPWIGTAISGPLGGMAISAACDVFGLTEKTEETLKAAIGGATPEQMLALKNADTEFALKMQELGFANVEKMEALAVENTKSAREMFIATKDAKPDFFAYLVTIGYFLVLWGMMSGELSAVDNQALFILLGSLGTAWITIISFRYGGSASSNRKTELLAQAPAIQEAK